MRKFTDVAYGSSKVQTLDLYLPEEGTGPWPLIFFIHGGGWFTGDKRDGQEIPWLTLREHGYAAVASVNYRLSGEAIHPAGIEDCEAAMRFLRENAAEYHIDPHRIATAGGSSGGHYALMLALDVELDVSCCVAWYPATDLAETMRTVRDGEYTGYGADFAWRNIERYVGKKIVDVNDETLIDASPIYYVSRNMPPVLLQHGNADTICPIDQSLRFYDAAIQAAGKDRVFMTVLDGAGHGDQAFRTETNMVVVRDFLASNLR